MKLKFLGAAGTVTGSKYLLETSRDKVLIDCGLFQGVKSLRVQNWEPLPTSAGQIDAVVLTHAHIDHSGYLPRLFQAGFRGVVHCTPATADLCRILLMDSAKLMEEEARYANRKGFSKHKPALPLFTCEDAKRVLELLRPEPFHAEFRIRDGMKAVFKRAGHILGAASVHLESAEGRVTFSGDVGRLNDPIMRSPEPLDETDILVVESTYGDRRHAPEDPQAELREVIREAHQQKGSVLIPAFAVGRAQEILYYLMKLKDKGHLPEIPVFLDSPMASAATSIFIEHMGDHRLSKEDCDRMLEGARFVEDLEESKGVQARTDPRIIISASGMATGGRVLHYMKKMAPDSRNVVLFAGFQAAGTRGAALLAGSREIKIHGEYVQVAARVRRIGNLSAHADAHELLQWLSGSTACRPKRVFITHGEPGSSDAMRVRLRDRFGWNCTIPAWGEEFEISNQIR